MSNTPTRTLEIIDPELAFLAGRLAMVDGLLTEQRQAPTPILRDVSVMTQAKKDARRAFDDALHDWLNDRGYLEFVAGDAELYYDESSGYHLTVQLAAPSHRAGEDG